MTLEEARSIALHLVAAWPNQTWGNDTLALYLAELCRWDRAQGEAAVRELVRTSKWCPTVSELVESCERHAILVPDRYALERGSCHLCEDGWVQVAPAGRGTVARCPNGCIPNAITRANAGHHGHVGTAEQARAHAGVAKMAATIGNLARPSMHDRRARKDLA